MSALSSASTMRAAGVAAAASRPRPPASLGGRSLGEPAQRLLDERPGGRSRAGTPRRASAMRSGRQVRRPERQRDREGGARAHAGCSTPIVAAVQRDQLLHQRQPDAGAFVGARPRALDAVEALEQARQLGSPGCRRRCRAPSAATRAVAARAARTRDLALERELERVRQQVEDDLLPHARDRRRPARGSGGQSTVEARGRARSIAERNVLARSAVSAARSVGSIAAPARGRPRCARSRAAC